MPTDLTYNLALLPDWLDAENIIRAFGPWAVPALVAMVFIECGLLLGFFIPAGESMLFTAGLLIGSGLIDMQLWVACVLLAIAACLGNLLGYYIGYRVGPTLFNKPDSKLFKREYVDKTHEFFEKYGARAIILGRWVPVIRTFITAIAGVGRMDFRKYAIYSTIGGVIWAGGVPILGYYLGQFSFIKDNLELAAILIVLISLIPIVIEFLKHRSEKAKTTEREAVK